MHNFKSALKKGGHDANVPHRDFDVYRENEGRRYFCVLREVADVL